MISFTIVLPVYNETKNLKIFNETLDSELVRLKDYNFKKIYINDGSKDDSKKTILDFLKKSKIDGSLVSFTKNFGHQNAIIAGLKNVESDFYIIMDTDLQHDPSLINLMINNIISSKIDIVQMKKKYGKYEGVFKRILSSTFYRIFKKLTDIDLKKGSSDFYLISKRVRDQIINSNFSSNFIRGFIHWAGYNKIFLDYLPNKRRQGKSSYNFFKQLELALTGLYYYTTKVYLFTFILALFFFGASIIYILYIIYQYMIGNIIPGWSELAILNLFFGSTLLLLMSIVLFLITKIFTIVSKKPDYIIEDFIKNKNE